MSHGPLGCSFYLIPSAKSKIRQTPRVVPGMSLVYLSPQRDCCHDHHGPHYYTHLLYPLLLQCNSLSISRTSMISHSCHFWGENPVTMTNPVPHSVIGFSVLIFVLFYFSLAFFPRRWGNPVFIHIRARF